MKITIITAVYNAAQTLADAMDSVLRQTYADIEYVVVDGGSKDGSVDVVRSY
jgi:glycosyltransferase